MKKQQNGFTLIELLIVVAIIGILAAVSIPLYREYTIRARVGNAVTSIAAIQSAVALQYSMTGSETFAGAGVSSGASGIATTGNWSDLGMIEPQTLPTEVSGINVNATGAIQITLTGIVDSSADGETITFTPSFGRNLTTWNAVYSNSDSSEVATPVINNYLDKTVKLGKADAADADPTDPDPDPNAGGTDPSQGG